MRQLELEPDMNTFEVERPQQPVMEVQTPSVRTVLSLKNSSHGLVGRDSYGKEISSPEALQRYISGHFMGAAIQAVAAIQKGEYEFALRINYVDYNAGEYSMKAPYSQLDITLPAGSMNLLGALRSALKNSGVEWGKKLDDRQRIGMRHFFDSYQKNCQELRAKVKDITEVKVEAPKPLRVIKSAIESARAGFANLVGVPISTPDVPFLPRVTPKVMHVLEEPVAPEEQQQQTAVNKNKPQKKVVVEIPAETRKAAPVDEFVEVANLMQAVVEDGKMQDGTALQGFSGLARAFAATIGLQAKLIFGQAQRLSGAALDKAIDMANQAVLSKLLPWFKGTAATIKKHSAVAKILEQTTSLFKRIVQWDVHRKTVFDFMDSFTNPSVKHGYDYLKKVAKEEEAAAEAQKEAAAAQKQAVQQKAAAAEKIYTADDIVVTPSRLEAFSQKVQGVKNSFTSKIRGLFEAQPAPRPAFAR